MSAEDDKMDVDLKEEEDNKPKDPKEPEDLTGDGGVLKEILREGEGWETPGKGSDVYVHYTGTLLDGTKFDSSRDRSQEFNFKLGAGQVIKGWDETVKSMKKGELCKVTLKPEYAYGAAGSPPKIPPNATLVFEIELLRFRNEKDITHDGGVLKKVLREPQEKYGPSPAYESKIKFRALGRLTNGTVIEDREHDLIIGDAEIPNGFEKALESLKVGERALFKIRADYAFGADGNAELNVPPNSDVEYEFELLDLVKEKDHWEVDKFEEKVECSAKRKNDGNEYFKAKKYAQAVRKYKRALDYFDNLYSASDAEKAQANTLKAPLHTNMAQCYILMKDYKKAIESCNKALEQDKKNPKALFRRAVANVSLGNWDAGKEDFEHVLQITPGDAAVTAEYAKLKKLMRAQDEKDKKIYQKLFA